MVDLKSLQGVPVLDAFQHRQIDRIVVVRPRGQRTDEDDLVGGHALHAERITQREVVLGQCAGLVSAQHVDAGQFLDGDQSTHDRLTLREQASADGHRHR